MWKITIDCYKFVNLNWEFGVCDRPICSNTTVFMVHGRSMSWRLRIPLPCSLVIGRWLYLAWGINLSPSSASLLARLVTYSSVDGVESLWIGTPRKSHGARPELIMWSSPLEFSLTQTRHQPTSRFVHTSVIFIRSFVLLVLVWWWFREVRKRL